MICPRRLSQFSPQAGHFSGKVGAPLVGFSADIRRIKARISRLTGFRPPDLPFRESTSNTVESGLDAQPTTVLGVIKTRSCFHADQRLRNITQNSFCPALSRRRGLLACSVSSCWRESEVLQEEIRMGTESTSNPTEKMPKAQDHGRILSKGLRADRRASDSFRVCAKF
jgi:hypothetical protein